MKKIAVILCLLAPLAISSCASYDFRQRTVQQGNLLPQQKIDKLSIGMSKQEVVALLGSTLLAPTFNNDRWDYAYTYRKGNKAQQEKRLVLFFSHGKLIKIQR